MATNYQPKFPERPSIYADYEQKRRFALTVALMLAEARLSTPNAGPVSGVASELLNVVAEIEALLAPPSV